MFSIQQLDQHVTHDQQVQEENSGPVVLVNIFHVKPEEADQLIKVWGDILRTFRSAPGFLSAQFHQGTAGSGTVLNYAVWESAAYYRAAYEDPTFRSKLPGYPDGAVATPHLFRKVAIENICVA